MIEPNNNYFPTFAKPQKYQVMEFTNEEGAKRLKSVSVALGLKLIEMGAQAGIGQQQMYDWTSGKLLPKWSNLVKIAEAFPQVSAEYLLRGKGSVLNE